LASNFLATLFMAATGLFGSQPQFAKPSHTFMVSHTLAWQIVAGNQTGPELFKNACVAPALLMLHKWF
jgi:hypothetical protein